MKSLLLTLFVLFASIPAKAQEFAFAPNSGSSKSAEKTGGYKKMVAQKVFDDLVTGLGDIRMQKPSLVINRRDGTMASFSADLIEVTLDEKAYNICTTFGKDSLNAIASLLAHELIHYYQKHDFSRHFAKENAGLETAKQLEFLKEGFKQETEADCLGGFLAFSVGYNTYGIMPELLKKAYQAYELPENLPGYPSLSERIKMVDGAMAQLRELQMVFETANLLTLLGNYAEASVYHRFILQTYQSREIYNNAGVNATLAALALIEPTDMPYMLPLELDPKSRLYAIKDNDQEKETRKNALLKSALEHFERALLLDENYSTAYLNKACVLALKGEWEDAEYVIRKGKKRSADALAASDFVVLQGVIAALQKDSISAVKYWEQAKALENGWAKTNLEILHRTRQATTVVAIPSKGLEEIEQFPIADFFTASDATPPDHQVKVADKVYCGIRQLPNSQLFIHYISREKYVLVQETQASYTGRTLRGIGLGDTQDKVVTAYGKVPRIIALPSGSVWVYPESKIFFRFSQQSKVLSWGVYRKSPL